MPKSQVPYRSSGHHSIDVKNLIMVQTIEFVFHVKNSRNNSITVRHILEDVILPKGTNPYSTGDEKKHKIVEHHKKAFLRLINDYVTYCPEINIKELQISLHNVEFCKPEARPVK